MIQDIFKGTITSSSTKEIHSDTDKSVEHEETKAHGSIMTICGPSRFHDAYRLARLKYTMQGWIVLTSGWDYGDIDTIPTQYKPSPSQLEIEKQVYARKIEMSDAICLLNVDGYLGENSLIHFEMAVDGGKAIYWWEPLNIPSYCVGYIASAMKYRKRKHL